MYEVRVEADFAAAHFLRDYHGKCENLHGHNYKVYAHVRGSNLDEGGMLLDFTQIKKTLRNVCELLDHKNLNDLTRIQAQNESQLSLQKKFLNQFRNLKTKMELTSMPLTYLKQTHPAQGTFWTKSIPSMSQEI